MSSNKLIGTAVLFLAVGFGDPQAHGEDSYALTYAASELTSAQGKQDVYARILVTARRQCPANRRFSTNRAVKMCIEGVVQDLTMKIDDPGFSAFVTKEFDLRARAIAGLHADLTG